jgi:hypothetical protein
MSIGDEIVVHDCIMLEDATNQYYYAKCRLLGALRATAKSWRPILRAHADQTRLSTSALRILGPLVNKHLQLASHSGPAGNRKSFKQRGNDERARYGTMDEVRACMPDKVKEPSGNGELDATARTTG